jgi:zinc transport system substrate-binding protein
MRFNFFSRYGRALGTGCAVFMAAVMLAGQVTTTEAASDKKHDHAHESGKSDDVYRGYFEDSQIKARTLSDWEGKWQSVYPYLVDGTLAPVLAHKAEASEKSVEEYRTYYETGYKTDVGRITINGGILTFYRDGNPAQAHYASDGHEVLTYKKGNRGVRYIFKKTTGDDAAPLFIQFSDHTIAPNKAGHYHLYFGDDRATLLKELTNWPTYYPSDMTGDDIVEEMLAH